jgi:nicotinamide mononucleotide transporter
MSLVEAVAVIFGLLAVGLSIRQNIWCWPAGLVQAALYILVFYQVNLYSDMVLHIIYVFLNVYGWRHWLHGSAERNALPVSRLTGYAVTGWSFTALAGAAVWGWGMANLTDAVLPYWNAFSAVTALIAQFLITRKKLEAWIFWIVVDIVAIGAYLYTGLYMTVLLYSCFMAMSVMGFFTWRRTIN